MRCYAGDLRADGGRVESEYQGSDCNAVRYTNGTQTSEEGAVCFCVQMEEIQHVFYSAV